MTIAAELMGYARERGGWAPLGSYISDACAERYNRRWGSVGQAGWIRPQLRDPMRVRSPKQKSPRNAITALGVVALLALLPGTLSSGAGGSPPTTDDVRIGSLVASPNESSFWAISAHMPVNNTRTTLLRA